MKTMRAALAITVSALVFAGCAKDNPVDTNFVSDQSDGRITVVNDESKLNTRVTNKNDSVQVDAVGLKKTIGVQAFSMTLVAEITPPVVNGQTLQATSVSLNNKFAYISYNLRGETYGGGVDVVQLKGGKNATLLSSATFNDTKVSSVFYDPTLANIYLAEASSNPAYAYPAVIELMKTQGNKLLLTGNLRTVLTSYVTTSVVVVNNTVYATTGNTGKVYMLSTDSLKINPLSFTLADARWVDYDSSTLKVAALQGGGKIYVFSASPSVSGLTYNFTGTSILESKSTVQVIGGKALIAAGDGGVVLMNIATGKVVGSIPRTIESGLDPALSVTNAANGASQYIYISNGEAGVYVAQASQVLENRSGDTPVTLTVLGKLRFSTAQSVNHVAFDGSTLVIASGLGGVKIVDVNF